MKLKIISAAVAMMGIASIASADEIDSHFQKARKYLQTEKVVITTTIDQAFQQEAIIVSGEGVGKKGTTGGQKKLTAKTAAKVAAQRHLAEILEGVAIVSETTVKDSELQSDVIKTAVTGFIKGAQIVLEDWNDRDETALVIMKLGLNGPKGFGALMYERIMNEPKIRQELDKPVYALPANTQAPLAQGYDGLIIDATDYNFRPALINRIFSPKGEVLYDPSKISQKVLVEQGCGEYTNSVDKARAALGKRGVKNPLVIKASGTVSPSDLQVADATAVQVFSANQAGGFMADARVAFVLK